MSDNLYKRPSMIAVPSLPGQNSPVMLLPANTSSRGLAVWRLSAMLDMSRGPFVNNGQPVDGTESTDKSEHAVLSRCVI
jgi:hypothetical protein